MKPCSESIAKVSGVDDLGSVQEMVSSSSILTCGARVDDEGRDEVE